MSTINNKSGLVRFLAVIGLILAVFGLYNRFFVEEYNNLGSYGFYTTEFAIPNIFSLIDMILYITPFIVMCRYARKGNTTLSNVDAYFAVGGLVTLQMKDYIWYIYYDMSELLEYSFDTYVSAIASVFGMLLTIISMWLLYTKRHYRSKAARGVIKASAIVMAIPSIVYVLLWLVEDGFEMVRWSPLAGELAIVVVSLALFFIIRPGAKSFAYTTAPAATPSVKPAATSSSAPVAPAPVQTPAKPSPESARISLEKELEELEDKYEKGEIGGGEYIRKKGKLLKKMK